MSMWQKMLRVGGAGALMAAVIAATPVGDCEEAKEDLAVMTLAAGVACTGGANPVGLAACAVGVIAWMEAYDDAAEACGWPSDDGGIPRRIP